MNAIDRILQRLQSVRAEIIANRQADTLRLSLDMLALVKLRIQKSGKDYTGAPFVPYAPYTVADRKAKGYQTGYVDFTQTGRLWANVQPVVIQSNVFSTTVQLQGSEKRSEDILQKAKPKRGDILRPSQQEIDAVRRANQSRINRYLTKLYVQ